MVRSHIALGSNLGDSCANVRNAIKQIGFSWPIVAQSSLYRTKPWGVLDQPDFINAVITIEVQSTPRELLDQLLAIEQNMGRKRLIKWGPRLIDLDILTFADLQVNEPGLTIPHPHMYERVFVLGPLSEIDSKFVRAYESLPESERTQLIRL